MTIFIVITLLLFAFMPRKNKFYQFIWTIFILSVGLTIAFSRVGVGAHFPLDVITGSAIGYILAMIGISITGSAIGYILAMIGIRINNKVNWWNWIENKKYYPIFIILLILWGGVIITLKILKTNLIIYYISLIPLIITLYLIIKKYVQKEVK